MPEYKFVENTPAVMEFYHKLLRKTNLSIVTRERIEETIYRKSEEARKGRKK